MRKLRLLAPLAGIAGLLVACVIPLSGSAQAEELVSRPPLVLVISIDQLRRDRLHAELPGGLGRIVRRGRVYERAVLDHAHTETCPGHASMLTGRHPGPAGVPTTNFVERSTLKVRYCADDPDPKAASFGGARVGRSPRNLRATTLGDWIKAEHPTARVFAVSGKDRSAIMLGGQKPDGVYWLDWRGYGHFTTSRYYTEEFPDWLAKWTRDEILEGIPARWEHPTGSSPNGVRPDVFPGESQRNSNASPHPLSGALSRQEAEAAVRALQAMPPELRAAEMQRLSLASFYYSPYLDKVTLRFARELVEREDLGNRDVPELLAISLSGTDLVGHLYGPWSQESAHALASLDRDLGSFLDFLEARVGKRRLLIALTADHGVLPLPEWLAAEKREQCPVPGGRIDSKSLSAALTAELDKIFGSPGSSSASDPRSPLPAPGWLVGEGFRFTVNRPLCAERGVTPEQVIAAAKAFLAARSGVARLWTPHDFADAAEGSKAALYRNSYHPQRGGDLIIEPAAGCLFSAIGSGTTHGSPHAYDRDVPIVLAGPGVEAGRDARPAATVDLGPTLAALIGIEIPPGLDGRVLPLAP